MGVSTLFTTCLAFVMYVLNVEATLICTKAAIAPYLPANTTLLYATAVAKGGSYGGGSADKDFPSSAKSLPALCAIQMQVYEAHSSYSM
jgi:hypothetical protein